MEHIVQVKNLKKSYRGQEAVRGISFQVNKGQLFALLGPNGAGKTTTINILCSCVKADSGSILVDGLKLGHQNQEICRKMGVVFQNGILDDLLTIEENLSIRGRFYGLRGKILQDRTKEIARMTGIYDFLDRPYGKLSGGQRRRCDIARALIHFPKILLLDEPTTGLDPKMRSAIWGTIDAIKAETDMTILLTTHYMEEAAKADNIVIMQNGEIAVQSTPMLLKEHFSQDSLVMFAKSLCPLKNILDTKGIQYRQKGNGLEVPLTKTLDALPLLELCRDRYVGFEVLRGNMDDAYLSVIERGSGHVQFCV
ncbi:MAG: ABC transporter ATP-binding protein [Lachnospiraceae bacterium]|nr:ABC transporter ATP-binding protein [Lachnospiraceae bacterium]